jgi:nicotinamidase/pyrazinamidase
METLTTLQQRNVLIAVDVQHDFIDGSLAVTNGQEVVEPLNEMARAVRAQEMGRVAFTRDWHPAQTPHFETWPVHCVQNTPGAEFSPALMIEPTDTVISKGMEQTDGYSGVDGVSTNGETLESIINPSRLEAVRVFIGGLATDYCVKATAIDLATRFSDSSNVNIYAVRDAIRAVNLNPDDELKAIEAMATSGVQFISLSQALDMIDATRLE